MAAHFATGIESCLWEMSDVLKVIEEWETPVATGGTQG
jgi:hypothetical protein